MNTKEGFDVGDRLFIGDDDIAVAVTALKSIENLEDLILQYQDTPHYKYMQLLVFHSYLVRCGYVDEKIEAIKFSDSVHNWFVEKGILPEINSDEHPEE